MAVSTPELPTGPAWAVAITLAGALAFVGREAIKSLRARGNSQNGPSGRLVVLVEQVEKNIALQTVALQTLGVTLTVLGDRLSQLPTKLDLAEQFEKSRHDMRNIIAPLIADRP